MKASRSAPRRAVCLHGHFYQPPREHAWLGVVEGEPSAAPDHDWNVRITRECYAPNAAARLLDARGRLREVVNVYEWTSFDFGPTLLSWLAPHAPRVMDALCRADRASRARTGHGNAWAQPYTHAIMPLCSPEDRRANVRWGRRDFEHRFGRPPEGMWLPEMAADVDSLTAMAEAGVELTMLAPHQARRIRPLGADEAAWTAVTPATLDVRRLYRCRLKGWRSIDVLFRDAPISQEVAFGGLLEDGARLTARLREAVLGSDEAALLGVAVDGETYGHHHRFGEMALAFAVEALARDADVALVSPAAFRAVHPPTHEVEIVEGTSWSCPHGVERWRADCGCRTGGPADWNQAWRTPLRRAIDWLRDEVAVLYATRAAEVFRDPGGARDRYVDCVLAPDRTAGFLAAEARGGLSPAAAVHARRVLELARHALLMQTSCGWFFEELSGVEPVLVMRHAARVIELGGELGRRLEDGFLDRLEVARSNIAAMGSGADVYRALVRPARATPARVAATGAMLSLLGHSPRLPGWEVDLPDDLVPDGRPRSVCVSELATGAASTVPVAVERHGGGPPSCRVGELRFSLDDLFPVQREALLDRLGREAVGMARAGCRAALAGIRPVLEGVLVEEVTLPPDLAGILGQTEAEAIAASLAERGPAFATLIARAGMLRQRGVLFPERWLAERISRALEERVATLPESAEQAALLLDLAAAAGVTLELSGAQVRAHEWWRTAPPSARTDPQVAVLRERLGLAPGD